jgi:hypothetical protein
VRREFKRKEKIRYKLGTEDEEDILDRWAMDVSDRDERAE